MMIIKNYLSLVKFSHTIFAMPFALVGFALGIRKWEEATRFFSGEELGVLPMKTSYDFPANWNELAMRFILVIFCMILARSAAMAFNRYLDRNFDALNPRTAIREIPKGIISANSALVFTIICCILFIICCYLINNMVLVLAPVALFVVLFYSYTKRFTPLCHLVLGLGLSLAPIGAYLAVTAGFDVLPILFSFAVLFWVSGFDIIYALQDEEFDKTHQLHSIPVAVGKSRALRISEVLHFLTAACIIAAGLYGKFSWLYWVGAVLFIAMLVYQHSVVKPNDLARVNLAFMTANGIASVVFALFVIADMVIGYNP